MTMNVGYFKLIKRAQNDEIGRNKRLMVPNKPLQREKKRLCFHQHFLSYCRCQQLNIVNDFRNDGH